MTRLHLQLLVATALALALFTSGGLCSLYTVYYDGATQKYSVQDGSDPTNGIAVAEYSNEMNTTGWARFNLKSNPIFSDDLQAFGSGYLEGVLSAELIWQSWYNFNINQFNGTPSPLNHSATKSPQFRACPDIVCCSW